MADANPNTYGYLLEEGSTSQQEDQGQRGNFCTALQHKLGQCNIQGGRRSKKKKKRRKNKKKRTKKKTRRRKKGGRKTRKKRRKRRKSRR